MPVYRKINHNFFKKWTAEMAYVLGFFAADGSIIQNNRGAHFVELEITDRKLLEKIRSIMGSEHKITARKRNDRWKTAYRLQIGSKQLYFDLKKIGIRPKPCCEKVLDKIPSKYVTDFIRGFFDGDGFVCRYTQRKRRSIMSGFVFSEKNFLETLRKLLEVYGYITNGTLYSHDRVWRLSFASKNSRKLWNFMYNNCAQGLFLYRKKRVFDSFFAKC